RRRADRVAGHHRRRAGAGGAGGCGAGERDRGAAGHPRAAGGVLGQPGRAAARRPGGRRYAGGWFAGGGRAGGGLGAACCRRSGGQVRPMTAVLTLGLRLARAGGRLRAWSIVAGNAFGVVLLLVALALPAALYPDPAER